MMTHCHHVEESTEIQTLYNDAFSIITPDALNAFKYAPRINFGVGISVGDDTECFVGV